MFLFLNMEWMCAMQMDIKNQKRTFSSGQKSKSWDFFLNTLKNPNFIPFGIWTLGLWISSLTLYQLLNHPVTPSSEFSTLHCLCFYSDHILSQ